MLLSFTSSASASLPPCCLCLLPRSNQIAASGAYLRVAASNARSVIFVTARPPSSSGLTRQVGSRIASVSHIKIGLEGLLRVARRYMPVTQHTSLVRALGALCAVVAVVVLAALARLRLFGRYQPFGKGGQQ